MEINKVSSIGRNDVVWNYLATFFQIGAGIIILPLILKRFSSETVGIWTIYMNISGLVFLMDFGFNPSFVRNITYIFSGVQDLKKNGISDNIIEENINYSLLKGTIEAMKWIYSIMSFIVLIILSTLGTWYILKVTTNYSGNINDIYISWFFLVLINSYNLYTLYYDALLQGKGLVKSTKQITVLSQALYLIICVILVELGQGLVAIVLAQLISTIVKRILCYRIFFTPTMKMKLKEVIGVKKKQILHIILPNSIKLGITQLGAFAITKSSIFIGAMYLTLSEIAQFGITMQVISILTALAGVYYQTFLPKIVEFQAKINKSELKKLYIKSVLIQWGILALGGCVIIGVGNFILSKLGSSTMFLSSNLIILLLVISMLEKNHALAAGFLLAKNEVPFFKASIFSGLMTILFLWLFLEYFKLGLLGMILAPGLAQLFYQNWKWPLVLIKELKE